MRNEFRIRSHGVPGPRALSTIVAFQRQVCRWWPSTTGQHLSTAAGVVCIGVDGGVGFVVALAPALLFSRLLPACALTDALLRFACAARSGPTCEVAARRLSSAICGVEVLPSASAESDGAAPTASRMSDLDSERAARGEKLSHSRLMVAPDESLRTARLATSLLTPLEKGALSSPASSSSNVLSPTDSLAYLTKSEMSVAVSVCSDQVVLRRPAAVAALFAEKSPTPDPPCEIILPIQLPPSSRSFINPL